MRIVDTIDNLSVLPIIAWPEYLKCQSGCVKVGYFVDNNMILPFTIRKKLFFKWMQLYTEVLFCESAEQERAFMNECVLLVKKKFRVSHIITSNTSIFKSYPSGADFCKWGSYKVDLTLDQEILFANLHSKHRNVIRKAQSLELKVQHGREYAKDVVQLMSDTYSRQGSSFSYGDDYINTLNKMGNNVEWWVVKDKCDNVHGSAIFLWSTGASCYYLHGGSGSHPASGAMNLLIWEAMLEMKNRGVKYFDFVGARVTTEQGSKLEGIQRFKSRFGASLYQGFMFRYIISPFYYKLHNIALHIFYILHGIYGSFDIIVQERKKGNY